MFQIRNGGLYARHDRQFKMERAKGCEHYVLLLTRSESLLTINEQTYSVLPNQILLIPPHIPYSYHNPNGIYVDSWIHFTCDKEDLARIDPNAFLTPFSVSDPPVLQLYLQQILWTNSYVHAPLCQRHVDGLFCFLFELIMEDFHSKDLLPYSPYRYPMQQLRIRLQTEPLEAPNAKEAASEIGISLSYFQHLYSDFFGISYQKDLIKMRIDYAMELLTTTEHTIQEISELCGYQNEVHFYRQFQKLSGMTPAEYRRSKLT